MLEGMRLTCQSGIGERISVQILDRVGEARKRRGMVRGEGGGPQMLAGRLRYKGEVVSVYLASEREGEREKEARRYWVIPSCRPEGSDRTNNEKLYVWGYVLAKLRLNVDVPR